MEPSIHRGDLLVLTNFDKSQPLVTGDIVVYKLPNRGVPIGRLQNLLVVCMFLKVRLLRGPALSMFLYRFLFENVIVIFCFLFSAISRVLMAVHRIMKVHEETLGAIDVLTKGDNNLPDDREVSVCSFFECLSKMPGSDILASLLDGRR